MKLAKAIEEVRKNNVVRRDGVILYLENKSLRIERVNDRGHKVEYHPGDLLFEDIDADDWVIDWERTVDVQHYGTPAEFRVED